MNSNKIRIQILESLDELGMIVENIDGDFNLQDYITDSITFITFIITIEKKLGIEVPDDLLLFDAMNSFYAYCDLLKYVVNNTY